MKLDQEQLEREQIFNAKRDSFMKRLESFSTLFHCIPRPFSAFECAKHGWKDTHDVLEKHPKICVLSCDDCSNKMYVIELDIEHAQKPDGKLSCSHTLLCCLSLCCVVIEFKKKYQDGLLKCHAEDCQWRSTECSDSVYNFPIVSVSEGLARFKNEANLILMACRNKQQSIPQLKHSLVKKRMQRNKDTLLA